MPDRSNHGTLRAMDTNLPDLSRREREVFHLLILGYTNGEIATQLRLSVRTAESHRAKLQHKLALPTRAALVRYAVERGVFADPGILELPESETSHRSMRVASYRGRPRPSTRGSRACQSPLSGSGRRLCAYLVRSQG